MSIHVQPPRIPLTTTIRIGAAAFEIQSADLTKPKDHPDRTIRLELAGAHLRGVEAVAATLCQLHGIGTKRQWQAYRHALKREHAAERQAHRKARLQRQAAKRRQVEGVQ